MTFLTILCSIYTSLCQDVGDIVITEVMVNPTAVPDNDGEWFEVFNATLDTFLFSLIPMAMASEICATRTSLRQTG